MKQGVHRQKYRLTPLYLSSKEECEMFTIEIYSARLKGFVIDEGHCFNKWSAIFDALLIPCAVVLHVLCLTGAVLDRIGEVCTTQPGFGNGYYGHSYKYPSILCY